MKKYISVTYLKIVIGTIILMMISFLCGVFSKSAVPNISDYAEVHISTLAHNYRIEADETNTAKTKIIISLADELSEYALLDEQDHIVLRGDEWLGVVDTSNPKVIFDNLESDKSYKVVARPKSDKAYTAMGQYQYHSVVSTEFEFDTVADKFILETQGGEMSLMPR